MKTRVPLFHAGASSLTEAAACRLAVTVEGRTQATNQQRKASGPGRPRPVFVCGCTFNMF